MAVKDVSPETKVTRGHHLTHDQPHTSKKANSYLLCKVILVTKHYKKESTVIGNIFVQAVKLSQYGYQHVH